MCSHGFACHPLTGNFQKAGRIPVVGKEDGLYPVISDYLKVLDEKKIKHDTFITDGGAYPDEFQTLSFNNCAKFFLIKL